MKFGLTPRLIASHAGVALLALLVFTGVIIGTTSRQAVRTGVDVDRATALRLAPWFQEFYRTNRSWDGLSATGNWERQPTQRSKMHMMPMMTRRGGAPFPSQLLEQPMLIVSANGVELYRRGFPTDRETGQDKTVPHRLDPTAGVPIQLPRGDTVYLFIGGMIAEEHNPLSTIFRRSTIRAAAITGVALLLSVLVVSIVWVRWLLRPIRDLEAATREITRGNYTGRVAVPPGKHELTDLVLRFNAMAVEVEAQEQSRRRFVGDAAHELRTPISLLATRIEMLKEGIYRPDGTQWDALGRDVGRLNRLVDELQTLARADAGKLSLTTEPWKIKDAIDTVCHHMVPAADEKGVAITVRMNDQIGEEYLLVDPERFRQIMANLIGNALRYTEPGSEVIVEVLSHEDSREGNDFVNDFVEVAVEDPGPGIAEADRKRVFERFVRLDDGRDRSGGGSGLGLAITAELVRMHGGTIHVESARYSSSGARFVVTVARSATSSISTVSTNHTNSTRSAAAFPRDQ